jgi:purine-nucleoside/S-methyl-5'-thioadenosine phosphorylase / adenosine deaminase
MHRITHVNLVYYQFERLALCGDAEHGVFTRLGGVSQAPFDSLNVGATVGDDPANVQANRSSMAAVFGARDADTRTSWQVHGADVVVIRGHEAQAWPPPQADGVITSERNLPLVMRFADCVPLTFYDPVRRAIGLAHAGWRGTVAGVGPATVKAMEGAFGSRPSDVIAGIGPAIGPCCFEVGPEVVDQFEAAFDSLDELLQKPAGNGDKPHLDLWRANELALQRAGVENIEVSRICTASTTSEFFSHRAEGGSTGRFGVVMVLKGGA